MTKVQLKTNKDKILKRNRIHLMIMMTKKSKTNNFWKERNLRKRRERMMRTIKMELTLMPFLSDQQKK